MKSACCGKEMVVDRTGAMYDPEGIRPNMRCECGAIYGVTKGYSKRLKKGELHPDEKAAAKALVIATARTIAKEYHAGKTPREFATLLNLLVRASDALEGYDEYA